MALSYTSIYAKLAREGINILSCTNIPEYSGTEYIFEYSWMDPAQQNKLHWSKAPFFTNSAGYDWVESLIELVRSARKELEA